jgi:hypothetical protein
MNPNKIDKKLLDYLDGNLTESEWVDLEDKINQSKTLRNRLSELKMVDLVLRKTHGIESPSKNFSNKVLQNLNNYERTEIKASKSGLLLLVGVITAILIAAGMLSLNQFKDLTGSLNLQDYYKKNELLKLPVIPLNGKLIINCILIVASGICLILLDRVILKPHFSKKNKVIAG